MGVNVNGRWMRQWREDRCDCEGKMDVTEGKIDVTMK